MKIILESLIISAYYSNMENANVHFVYDVVNVFIFLSIYEITFVNYLPLFYQ